MAENKNNSIDPILEQINPARRSFLQRLLFGTGALVLLALPKSDLLAEEPGQGDGKGDGKGAE